MNLIDKYSITGDPKLLLAFTKKVERVFSRHNYNYLHYAIIKVFGSNTFISSEIVKMIRNKGSNFDFNLCIGNLNEGDSIESKANEAKIISKSLIRHLIVNFNTPVCCTCGGVGRCIKWCRSLWGLEKINNDYND